MTAPTLSVYPRSVDELMPQAHDLVARLGTVPSRNRIKTELRVGGPKADAILDRLTRPTVDPDATPTGTAPDAGAADRPKVHPDPHPDATEADPLAPDAPTVPGPDASPVVGPAPDVAEAPEAASGQAAPAVDPGPNITTTPTANRSTGRGWAYVGVILGGVVSIAANVAHTYLPKPPDGAPTGWAPDPGWSPSPLAVALSVFWPVALFVAVEILTRIPWGEGFSSVVARVAGVLPVAVVAAVVSYRHLSGLLEHFGEDPLTIAIGPLAVDGLMVMASAALLVTNRRSRT
ncbi:hypothetical protein MCAG_04596 [Micromonospora sp. ATCC 39149]|uniref:DUF2637 domain-containing protein n=1 Tax=Micromonospora carbonacea TaxID=47853 RepID=A0A7D6CEC6_9ACTN|nr:DUF2637 domain-containing protein [Micromonospora sp. ATCC 39149]EEP74269.1 hypothetical protein MCAG_04596 [Micromonospora sp. ATCC 39149]QLK00111.1 DUF2637 domain-containing protein [Micromonospora carbonacea]